MNSELFRNLQEGIATADRLHAMLQEDQENLGRCVNGEILHAYLKATGAADRELKKLRAEVVDFQDRQMLAL